MRKVRIGFVGVGRMGQCAHLRSYVTIPDCEVVAIAELRKELAAAVASRYGVPRVYHDHNEMISNEELDGIVASQPYQRHGALAPELYKAGVPVFTEKPLANSVEAGEKIVAALRESGVKHYVGYHKRSDPATVYAKERIDRLKKTGELGGMRYVRITMPPGDWIQEGFVNLVETDEKVPELPADPPAAEMDEAARRSYGGFLNYFSHQTNLMRHLLCEDYEVAYVEPSRVLMVVRSESGIAGALEMAPYRTSVDWQEEAFVGFERGYIRIELPAPLALNRPGRVTMMRDPGEEGFPETTVPQLPWIDAMRQQAMFFVKATRGERTPLCEAEEALKDLKIGRDYIRALGGEGPGGRV